MVSQAVHQRTVASAIGWAIGPVGEQGNGQHGSFDRSVGQLQEVCCSNLAGSCDSHTHDCPYNIDRGMLGTRGGNILTFCDPLFLRVHMSAHSPTPRT